MLISEWFPTLGQHIKDQEAVIRVFKAYIFQNKVKGFTENGNGSMHS